MPFLPRQSFEKLSKGSENLDMTSEVLGEMFEGVGNIVNLLILKFPCQACAA